MRGAGPADADRLAFACRGGQTIHHICGTCRMSGDPASMTDPRLRVRGIASSRAVDACVMPGIVSGITQAALLTVGEKAADLIRA